MITDTFFFSALPRQIGFLDGQVSAHHGIGVGGMSQKVFADLNRPAHRRNGHFFFAILHISAMQQSAIRSTAPIYLLAQSEIAAPRQPETSHVPESNQPSGQKAFSERCTVLASPLIGRAIRRKNQAAVSGGYFERNRLGTKDPAANSGRWGTHTGSGQSSPVRSWWYWT